jgi:hypothetical protein
MSWLVVAARIRKRLFERRLDRDLDEELRAPLAIATEENIRQGMSADDAHHAALQAFGGVGLLSCW